jgi:hypothetical protein
MINKGQVASWKDVLMLGMSVRPRLSIMVCYKYMYIALR